MSELQVEELRREFDRSFQEKPRVDRAARQELLLIRVGQQSYGLRLEQVEGVARDKRITPLPGAPADLLGIAGFRGLLVGVYNLASWLGEEPGAGGWCALVKAPGETRVALAFDALERQLSVEPAQLLPSEANQHVDSVLTTGQLTLPVLSVESLVAHISQRGQR